LFYDGERKDSNSNSHFRNINPATGKVLHKIEEASKEDIDAAVKSAERAFKMWSKTSPTERGRILKKAARIMRERNEEIVKVEVEDCGKPITESLTDDVLSSA